VNIRPSPNYSSDNESRYRTRVAEELRASQRVGGRLYLTSPNGTRYEIKVANDGALSTEAQTR